MYEIISADEKKLAIIEEWLREEEVSYQKALEQWKINEYDGERPTRGFLCNWASTVKNWRKDQTPIWVLMVNEEPVGFLVGMAEIMEIRADLRRLGYGRRLVQFMIDNAYKDDRSVIEIEISNETAFPFWERMGFTLMPDRTVNDRGMYAYKMLTRKFSLGDGQSVSYAIKFYTETERYCVPPKICMEFVGVGERCADGAIQLPERICCFCPYSVGNIDYFIQINVDEYEICFDKIKRAEVQHYGVKRDNGYIYFVDQIKIPHF